MSRYKIDVDRAGLYPAAPACGVCGDPLSRPAAASEDGTVYCSEHADAADGEVDR